MHDSVAGDPMWLISSGGGTNLNVEKMTNVLSGSATFTNTSLAVDSYSGIVPPKQPDGTAITTNIDSRILKVAEWNGELVATHAISTSSTQDDARWYRISVASGTPSLLDQGDVVSPATGAGTNNVYDYYPSIDINAQGDIGMTFMQSGTAAGQFMSVYVTGRTATDAAGTMETPVLVQAGAANYHDSAYTQRAGDLSGISVDADGTFWAANEHATAAGLNNWGTWIANFSVTNPSWSHVDLADITGAPAAAAGSPLSGYAWESNGSKQVFYLTPDGHVHALWVTPSIPWSHIDLTAVTGAPAAAAGSPLSGYAWEGHDSEQVFYLTPDGHVQVLWVTSSIPWSHVDLTAFTGAPPAAAGSPLSGYPWESNNSEQVVYLTPDGHVHELSVMGDGDGGSGEDANSVGLRASSLDPADQWQMAGPRWFLNAPEIAGGSSGAREREQPRPLVADVERFFVARSRKERKLTLAPSMANGPGLEDDLLSVLTEGWPSPFADYLWLQYGLHLMAVGR
jgi:hypothetical protein